MKEQELNEFLWNHWDDYFDNVTIRFKNGAYHINCKKGLWGVSNRDLKAAAKQAGYYFCQYWDDGEYDGTAAQKLIESLKN